MNGENSHSIRKRILRQRRELDPGLAAELSRRICERFLALVADAFFRGRRIALYRAMVNELDPIHLEASLIAAGARLHYPRIKDRASNQMEMVEVDPRHPDAWTPGPYGVLEPDARHAAVDPALLDMILVPGAVFDESGARIGMGKGYYDRFLQSAPQALRVALAFDFQLLSRIPQEPWDRPVHWIVTESREARASEADGLIQARLRDHE